MSRKTLSPKAARAFNQLSQRERAQIRKENPIKLSRNMAIRALRAEGMPRAILAELSGLNVGSISRILKIGGDWRQDVKLAQLRVVEESYVQFSKALSRVLTQIIEK